MTNQQAPKHSPWGRVQHATKIADGIYSVSTAGHGGIWLSRERAAIIPDYISAATFGGSGPTWFEEDSDWALTVLVFEKEWQAYDAPAVEQAKASARNWHPDVYEKFYGVMLSPGESYKRREATERTEQAIALGWPSRWVTP